MQPIVGSLFSGYGGLDMAVLAHLGGSLAWVCDNEPAAAAVLAHRHPGVRNLGDVTAVDFAQVEPVEVLTAGFPCQDVADAGLRAGIAPGTRSGLWSWVRHAVHTLRPRLVVIENVRGLLRARADSHVEPCPACVGKLRRQGTPAVRALGLVLGDLADVGYDAEWCGLYAADAGAPHRRFRVVVAAWPAAHPVGEAEFIRAGLRGGGAQARGRAVGGGGGSDDGAVQAAAVEWGPYAAAVARWARIVGYPPPAPIVRGVRGEHTNPAFTEWMMGLPRGWITEVPGMGARDALKLCGNGVVPQQAALALAELVPV